MKKNTTVYLLNPVPSVRNLINDFIPEENYHHQSLRIITQDVSEYASGWEMTLFDLQKIFKTARDSGFDTNFQVAVKRDNDGPLRFCQRYEWLPAGPQRKKLARKVARAVTRKSANIKQSTFKFITE